jgi:hypothetical protein
MQDVAVERNALKVDVNILLVIPGLILDVSREHVPVELDVPLLKNVSKENAWKIRSCVRLNFRKIANSDLAVAIAHVMMHWHALMVCAKLDNVQFETKLHLHVQKELAIPMLPVKKA